MLVSRLGLPYRFWKKLGVFAHGNMDDPAVCLENFRLHLATAGFTIRDGRIQAGTAPVPQDGLVVLELGPGDSLFTALVAYGYGATRCYLIDGGDYANRNVDDYRIVARQIADRGLRVPQLDEAQSLDEVLSACRATYLTEGIASLRSLPTASMDFIFSNAVLEHVRRHELSDLLSEMRRVLKPTGRCCHRVDLQDHLGGALNNLRFADAIWESSFMAQSGFYTNRIRYREMLSLFEQAGFLVEVKRELRWKSLPTPRNKLHSRFRSLDQDDLLVYGFDVVLRAR